MNLISEAKRMKMQVHPPSVNESFWEFRPNGKGIAFGLGAVKNVGQSAVDAIVKEREQGKYESFLDFLGRIDHRAVNKRSIESMIKAGALDSLDNSRARLLASLGRSFDLASKKKLSKGQTSLFGAPTEAPEAQSEDWSKGVALANEREALGFYLSGHPLEKYRDELESFTNCTSSQLEWFREEEDLLIGGIIGKVKTTTDKKGRKMAFVALEDFEGEMDVTVFSKLYEEHNELLTRDNMILLKGKKSTRNGRISIRAQKIIPLEDARSRFVDSVEISLETEGLEEQLLHQIKKVLLTHSGKSRVLFDLKTDPQHHVRIASKSIRVSADDDLFKDLRRIIGTGDVRLVGVVR